MVVPGASWRLLAAGRGRTGAERRRCRGRCRRRRRRRARAATSPPASRPSSSAAERRSSDDGDAARRSRRPGRSRRARRRRRSRDPAAAADRLADAHAGPGRRSASSSSGSTLSWALPKRSTQSTSAAIPPSSSRRERQDAGQQRDRVDLGAELARAARRCTRWAAAGAKTSRPAKVGPGRREVVLGVGRARRPARRRRPWPPPGPAARCRDRRAPTRRRPTSTAIARRSVPTPGVDDGEHDAGREVLDGPGEGQPAGPHVVGRDVVGDVDDRRRRARAGGSPT